MSGRQAGVLGAVALAVVALVGIVVAVGSGGGGGSPPTTLAGPATTVAGPAAPSRLSPTTVVVSRDTNGDVELYGVDADSGAVDQLTHEAGFDGVPAVSPDRRSIAYLHSASADNQSGPREIRVVGADGSGARAVARGVQSDSRPAWSPDGTRLAFPVGPDASADIAITPSDGSGSPSIIASDPEKDSDPAFSPDGTKVTYTRDVAGPSGASEAWVVPVAGGTPSLLISDAGVADLSFSRQGGKVVYSGRRTIGPSIVISAPDGKDRKLVPHRAGAFDADPSWSADGTRVVFSSKVGSQTGLFVFDIGAGTVKEVVTSTAPSVRGQTSVTTLMWTVSSSS